MTYARIILNSINCELQTQVFIKFFKYLNNLFYNNAKMKIPPSSTYFIHFEGVYFMCNYAFVYVWAGKRESRFYFGF